jgi:hypothetical protein
MAQKIHIYHYIDSITSCPNVVGINEYTVSKISSLPNPTSSIIMWTMWTHSSRGGLPPPAQAPSEEGALPEVELEMEAEAEGLAVRGIWGQPSQFWMRTTGGSS